jgi:hypothetical protein
MRAAPAVAVACSDAGGWRWVHVVLPALTAAVVTAWLAARLDAALAAAVLMALLLFARRDTTDVPYLAWDQSRWSLRHGGAQTAQTGQVTVALDLTRWMLLRWQADGGGVGWLVVAAATVGAAWPDLRAALLVATPMRASDRP